MQSTAQLTKFWDSSSRNIPANKDHSRYAETAIKDLAPHSTICDLGGGTGADAIYFARAGHTVTLYDISSFAMKQAVKKAEKMGLSIATKQADFGDSKFKLPVETFDLIYSRLTLHYFKPEQMYNILTTIYEALRTNGKAMITLKSSEDKKEIQFLKSTAKEIEPGVFEDKGQIKMRLNLDQLRDVMKKTGLPDGAYSIREITEDLGGRVDAVKSGNMTIILNEIIITKVSKL